MFTINSHLYININAISAFSHTIFLFFWLPIIRKPIIEYIFFFCHFVHVSFLFRACTYYCSSSHLPNRNVPIITDINILNSDSDAIQTKKKLSFFLSFLSYSFPFILFISFLIIIYFLHSSKKKWHKIEKKSPNSVRCFELTN